MDNHINHKAIKALVKHKLETAHNFEWTIQGFGMLRLHLSDEWRLNVWDERFAVPNVSLIHTHPWNFDSMVVAGSVTNHLYEELGDDHINYNRALMMPGVNFISFEGSIEKTSLYLAHTDLIREGEVYHQEAEEIHSSHPMRGTVTLNERRRVGEDRAYVYWPDSTEWVSAKPRVATPDEVKEIVMNSLKTWF